MGGFALANAIRSRWPDLPVTLLSGHGLAAKDGSLAAGVPVLHKPVDAAAIAASLARAASFIDDREDRIGREHGLMSRKELIYLLEDEEDLAAVLRRALETAAMEVRHFALLADFRTALEERTPSLCIVDLGLPDGDGLSVLGERLGADAIPTVVVSGRATLDDRLKGLEQGADDYLPKPVEPAELVARVRSVLRRARPAASAPRLGPRRSGQGSDRPVRGMAL